MAVSMVLFEHAAGYGLFRVKEFEEISALQTEVEAAILDVSAFNSVVSLLAFSPFKNAAEALANINAVSEGLPTDQVLVRPNGVMPPVSIASINNGPVILTPFDCNLTLSLLYHFEDPYDTTSLPTTRPAVKSLGSFFASRLKTAKLSFSQVWLSSFFHDRFRKTENRVYEKINFLG